MMIQGPGAGGQGPGAAGPTDPARLKETVEQFEALLLAQMLRAMHASGAAGWLGGEEDAAAESALGLAEEHFSRALAARGGLGLAGMVMRGLEAEEARGRGTAAGGQGEEAGRVRS